MPIRRTARVLAAVSVLLAGLVTACGGDDPKRGPQAAPPASPSASAAASADASLVQVPVQVPAGLQTAPFDVPRQLTVPIGWSVQVYARINRARFMTVTPNGDLLVSQPSTGSVLLVRRDAATGAGTVSEFGTGLRLPHDLVIADVGGRTWLFIAESHRVVRYPYAPGDQRLPAGEVVVDGLPDKSTPELRGQYNHDLKNIAVRGNTLYVSIASTCNACVSDTRSDPQRATIYTYDATGRNADRKLFARGLRNAEGLAFVPGTDELWVVVNNRDNTLVPDDRDVDGDGKSDKGKRLTAYVDDHPPEEFVKVRDGGFYGWPFCNPNIDNGTRNMPFDRDYELNRDGKAADCNAANRVDVGLPAHTAPLGLTFTQGTKAPDLGAIIPLHGSWNRSRPIGYEVVHFPWTPSGPGEQRDLVTGWLDESTGKSWGRPVDAAIDADGSILISDDAGNSVIRLVPPK
jgi:glucose/arabinose dehydrogenase